jgi:hypothetical protein
MEVAMVAILLPAAPVAAQEDVEFSENEVLSQFPDQLTFRIRVSSPEEEIVRAEFAYSNLNLYSPESYTVEKVVVPQGDDIILEYTLDTRDLTTPPMMRYIYHWEVELASGADFISDSYTASYVDNRYTWKVMENDQVGVWWHDRPDDFGDKVFEIATAAVGMEEELFETKLESQLLVVINNDPDEFASWHDIPHDWVGGQTFPDDGITVQIVNTYDSNTDWLYSVIPHEISHIFFSQLTYNPSVSVPYWLNEGVAQHNEMVTHDWLEAQMRDAAAAGDLIPLSKLANGFGSYNTDRIYLAYDEALSAVNYLVETYGSEGLAALLAAYKEGLRTDKAFPQALGVSATQFELDWAASLGAVGYQISTTRPAPLFLPSPTFGPAGNSTPQSATTVASTPTSDSSEAVTPRPTPEQPAKSRGPLGPCLSGTAVLGFGLAGIWNRRRSQ